MNMPKKNVSKHENTTAPRSTAAKFCREAGDNRGLYTGRNPQAKSTEQHYGSKKVEKVLVSRLQLHLLAYMPGVLSGKPRKKKGKGRSEHRTAHSRPPYLKKTPTNKALASKTVAYLLIWWNKAYSRSHRSRVVKSLDESFR